MNTSRFSKVNKGLEQGRYFSTIWCTLDSNVTSYLQRMLRPIKPYCVWLSTFGDSKSDAKYLPHITLRYLGYTDELDKKSLISDLDKFKKALDNIDIKEVLVKDIDLWEPNNATTTDARLNWKILDKTPLINLHKSLLSIPNYQFYETLEDHNYNPHISLGRIDLKGNNYKDVKSYLLKQNYPSMKIRLSGFAINYAKEGEREEYPLVK